MPVVRPFRALRYAADAVPDLAAVVAPPYDVVDADAHRRLLARHPRNAVRLDLPTAEPGDVDPDEKYRRAARLLTAWRGDGTLRRDARPTVTVIEDAYRLPGREEERLRRGFLARVGLEPFGDAIRAHERTLSGPKEDRYRLLRATGVNTSPIVAMYEDPGGRVAQLLAEIAAGPPDVDIVDDGGVRRRAWIVPSAVATGAGPDERTAADELCALAAAGPLTIADGHHRYETALRYRDERWIGPAGATSGGDDVLMLLVEPRAGTLDILPTQRVVTGVGGEGLATLAAGLERLFEVEAGVSSAQLIAAFGPLGGAVGGAGRFGLWTRAGGAVLRARRGALAPLIRGGGPALRRLDVTILGAALEALLGLDEAAIATGDRIVYTKDAATAIALVDAATDGADVAWLLEPTPAREIAAVAAEGDVMPQKSTYIYPKAVTGLVINPLEG